MSIPPPTPNIPESRPAAMPTAITRPTCNVSLVGESPLAGTSLVGTTPTYADRLCRLRLVDFTNC